MQAVSNKAIQAYVLDKKWNIMLSFIKAAPGFRF